MRAIMGCVAVLVLAGLTCAADDKIDTKKLVGKWELAEKDIKGIIEFKNDGKVTLTMSNGDKTLKAEGTYKLDGNKINTEFDFNGKTQKETHTITKLTDTELVTKDAKGKEDTFKKAK